MVRENPVKHRVEGGARLAAIWPKPSTSPSPSLFSHQVAAMADRYLGKGWSSLREVQAEVVGAYDDVGLQSFPLVPGRSLLGPGP